MKENVQNRQSMQPVQTVNVRSNGQRQRAVTCSTLRLTHSDGSEARRRFMILCGLPEVELDYPQGPIPDTLGRRIDGTTERCQGVYQTGHTTRISPDKT